MHYRYLIERLRKTIQFSFEQLAWSQLRQSALSIGMLITLAACSTIEPAMQPAVEPIAGPVGPPAPAPVLTERADAAQPAVESRKRTVPPQAQTKPRRPLPRTGGAYFENDGPGDNPPAEIDGIPDARPRKEALASWANRPYTLFGRQYIPEREIRPFKQRGVASWYGRKFHGNKTAIGERYDMYAMTAAHPTLPIPSYARVTNVQTGLSVVVRVNDRGPFLNNRVIDLSYTAAHKLGYLERGHTEVIVEQIALDQPQDAEPTAANNTAIKAATRTRPAKTASALAVAPVVKGNAEDSLTETSSNVEALASKESGILAPTALNDPLTQEPRTIQTNSASIQIAAPAKVFVQMAAFQNRENAIWAAAYVEEHFSDPSTTVEIHEQGGWYKVQVGPYNTRERAQALRERVRESTNFTPFLALRQSAGP